MKIRFCTAATVLFAVGAQASPSADCLSLMRAAVARNAQVNAAVHEVRAARHGIEQVDAVRWPRLSIEAGEGYRSSHDEERFVSPKERGPLHTQTLRAVYDMDFHGRNEARQREARSRLDETVQQLHQTIASVLAETAEACIRAHHADRLAESERNLLADLKMQLQETEAMLRFGQTDRTTVLLVKQEIVVINSDLIGTEGDLQMALASLHRLSGQPVNRQPGRPHALLKREPQTSGQTIKLALANNPSVKIAEILVERAEAQRDVANRDLYPTWQLEAAASRNRFDGEENRDITVSALFRYTLFDGGARYARLQESRQTLTSAQSNLKHTKEETERRVSELNSRIETLDSVQSELIENSRLAHENLEDALYLLERRELAAPAMISVERSTAQADIRLASNLLQLDLAILSLMAETGILPQSAGIDLHAHIAGETLASYAQ